MLSKIILVILDDKFINYVEILLPFDFLTALNVQTYQKKF